MVSLLVFVNGDWNERSLAQLEGMLNRRYAWRRVTFRFVPLTSGGVELVPSSEQPEDICKNLNMYVEGFFDGWSIANGG